MTIYTFAAAQALEKAGMENDHAEDLATKYDLNALEGRLNERFVAFKSRFEAKPANAINRMLLGNMAVAGLLFAVLKLFN